MHGSTTKSDVSRIIESINAGERHASQDLLPLIYDELRRLASQKLAREPSSVSIQATALVHEAYLRLVGGENDQRWDSRGHFFAAAAEAMRRILIENARKRMSIKHGGDFARIQISDIVEVSNEKPERLLELDEALSKLSVEDEKLATIVKLHFFAGQSLEEIAKMFDVSRATAYRQMQYARSWLKCEMEGGKP